MCHTCSAEIVMGKAAKSRLVLFVLAVLVHRSSSHWELEVGQDDSQPLSKIALHRSTQKLDKSITISANPVLLGQKVHYSQLSHRFLLKSFFNGKLLQIQ